MEEVRDYWLLAKSDNFSFLGSFMPFAKSQRLLWHRKCFLTSGRQAGGTWVT